MSWPTAAIKDVADVVSGATPKSKVAEYWGDDIRWATPTDLSKNEGAYLSETARRITHAGLQSCAAQVLPPRSVLMSSRAPIGLVAINTEPMATNQGFKSLVPDRSRVFEGYLYHWLAANTAYLQSLGNGATFKEVSKTVVQRIEIPLPPLEEQRRIAVILDAADALRRRRREALALLDTLPGAIFAEMFGDPLVAPHGHDFRPLADFIDPERKITYGILKPGPDTFDGVPYVRVVDMKDGTVCLSELKRTTDAIATSYRRSSLKAGDLLISIRGHVGRMAMVPESCDGANITQDTARLALTKALPEFIAGYLSLPSVQHWMAQRTKGVAVKGINLGDLKKLPVPDLPIEKQYDFQRARRRVLSQRKAMANHLIQLEALFTSLQSRAFAGEL